MVIRKGWGQPGFVWVIPFYFLVFIMYVNQEMMNKEYMN